MAAIEVRVAGKGSVRDGEAMPDPATTARCDLCAQDVDVVVSTGAHANGPFACKSCLRNRLESVTIALWVLDERGGRGLPWGKISG